MKTEGTHRIDWKIEQVYGVGAKMRLRRDRLPFPFDRPRPDICNFHTLPLKYFSGQPPGLMSNRDLKFPHRDESRRPEQPRRRKVLVAVLPHHDFAPQVPLVVPGILFDDAVGPVRFLHPAHGVDQAVADPDFEKIIAGLSPAGDLVPVGPLPGNASLAAVQPDFGSVCDVAEVGPQDASLSEINSR